MQYNLHVRYKIVGKIVWPTYQDALEQSNLCEFFFFGFPINLKSIKIRNTKIYNIIHVLSNNLLKYI